MIFSLRCFLKDKLQSSMRAKCFWSFIFATIVPLNIICGWFGLDFLQENNTSLGCLVVPGLNSNFHLCAHWRMMSRWWSKSFADISGVLADYSCHTLSKALEMSRNNVPTSKDLVLSKACLISAEDIIVGWLCYRLDKNLIEFWL